VLQRRRRFEVEVDHELAGHELVDNIEQSVNAYMRTLRSRGALINGKCIIDPDANPRCACSTDS
jgi:phage tail sheath protein FI